MGMVVGRRVHILGWHWVGDIFSVGVCGAPGFLAGMVGGGWW